LPLKSTNVLTLTGVLDIESYETDAQIAGVAEKTIN
jgi:hypothetical protein